MTTSPVPPMIQPPNPLPTVADLVRIRRRSFIAFALLLHLDRMRQASVDPIIRPSLVELAAAVETDPQSISRGCRILSRAGALAILPNGPSKRNGYMVLVSAETVALLVAGGVA